MLLQFWAGVINCTFDILKIISRTSRMPDIPEHILIKDPSVPEAAHMTAIHPTSLQALMGITIHSGSFEWRPISNPATSDSGT